MSSPSSMTLPRGRATIAVMSNVTDCSSVTSGGATPARSARERSSSPGTRRKAYVVTVPSGPSPVTANGITRAAFGSEPRRVVPSTVTPPLIPWVSPHRLTSRSSTSPPDHDARPVSTSTPFGKSSRVSAVSTVSSTTG